MRRAFRRIALFALLAAAACRAVAVESDPPGTTYGLEVENATAAALVVSWRDDAGTHRLGTVQAGQTQRFVVAGATGEAITVTASDVSGMRATRPRTVTLRPGVTTSVRLTF